VIFLQTAENKYKEVPKFRNLGVILEDYLLCEVRKTIVFIVILTVVNIFRLLFKLKRFKLDHIRN